MTPVTLSVEVVARRLVAAGCVAADEEAAELVAAAAGDDELEEWIARREEGEPLAWITGTLQFCALPIVVDIGVYVPRLQSEELARRAAARLPAAGTAAELCAGSAAIAAHMLVKRPSASVVAIDVDISAARCAARNHVPSLVGDLGAPLRSGVLDVVVAVAPYVPTDEIAFLPSDVQRYEPGQTLDGGPDGLELVRRVVSCAARLLRPGGWLLLELGADQDVLLGPALVAGGFGSLSSWHDEDGDLRGLEGRKLLPLG